MTRKQWFWVATGVVVLVAGFAWAVRPRPVLVEAAEVRQGQFAQTVDEDGKTRVRERYVVSAPLAGQLARIRLKAGDEVKAGAVVAQLSPSAPSMIDARTAGELMERVGAAQAALAAANANLARSQAALAQARADLERQLKLEQQKFIAAAARERAELEVEVQVRSVEAARFAVDGARHDLAQARAALVRAQDAAARPRQGTTWPIESPVSGRVLRVLQESEAAVAVGAPLIEIADPADLEVVAEVLSTDGARIRPGAAVLIEAGGEVRFSGWVRHVEPSAFTKISALGVEEQRVNVVIDITSPRQRWASLGDQFRVDVRITVFERADAVIAPVAALFRDGRDWAVFVVQEGRAVQRKVKVGARTSIDAWIEEGLQPGERVIVYPSDSVRDGRRVSTVRGG
jgi:HlyD family secretion protein